MTRTERLTKWAEDLTEDQMRPLLVQLVDFAIDAEMVKFYDDVISPYWDGDGEPLIEGQITYADDD